MALELYQTFKNSRLYREILPDGRRRGYCTTTLGQMNYESVNDSGDFDTPVDMTMTRVTNAGLDGYSMENAGWHYSVQIVDPAQSTTQPNNQSPAGTVGFGGRQGQNWFRFRLSDMGYIHWPTRSVQGLGGSPDYSEAPTIVEATRNLGNNPEVPDDIQTSLSQLSWGNLWSSPGGGEVSARWLCKANKLKEEIIINQAGREWLQANSPPTTPVNETYFGFRFEIDVSDVPRVWRDGVRRNWNNDDFDDDEGDGIELTDAQDRLLAFMPLDFVFARGRGGRRPLRKRFYRQGGRNYLYVGVRVDQLSGLLPGDLVFDPSMTQEQIQATADDCYENGSTGNYIAPPFSNEILVGFFGYELNGGWRFTPNVPADASFTGGGSEYASLRLYQGGAYGIAGTPQVNFYVDVTDGDAPAWEVGTGAERPSGTGVTNSTAATNFAPTVAVGSNNQWNGVNGIDVAAQMEEACAVSGWAANNGMRFFTQNNGSAGSEYFGVADFDDANTEARLDAFYTTAGGGGGIVPLIMHHRQQMS